MISESQQEQAALHALGLLPADDAAAFEREMAGSDELRLLVYELRETCASLTLAEAPASAVPSAGLKARLTAQFDAESRGNAPTAGQAWTTTVDASRPQSGRWAWIPWAMAAALLGFCGVMGWRETLLRNELADLRARWPSPTAPVNALTQVAVCELEATPEAATQPRAAVLWDTVRHQGVLRAVQLKPPGVGKDYQLWVVEKGRPDPVSAGIVTVASDGSVRMTFEPTTPGDNNALAFAVSLEKAGGSPTKEGPIVLIGNL